jgi:broad-specificity NMP kinase
MLPPLSPSLAIVLAAEQGIPCRAADSPKLSSGIPNTRPPSGQLALPNAGTRSEGMFATCRVRSDGRVVCSSVILWVNGPFGVGKTTVARLLAEQMPGSRIINPEHAGYVMRRTFWRGRDYQDVAAWRHLTRLLVKCRAKRHDVIVPMTVVDRGVFEDVTRGARVFALVAQEATISSRIAGSDEAPEWRTENVDGCLAAFATDTFGKRISTDGRMPSEVAQEILERLRGREEDDRP